ncbi:MAG: hypothetical protein KAI45_08955, partial [Melioribacteraceae bacterium]|nr:hypothetical protein [Melioribacteraceae bacterium]
MRNKKRFLEYFLITIITSLFLSTSFIYSQNENIPQQKEEEKVEEPKAIPVIEIPQKIEEAYTTIKEIEALKLPATPLKDLDSNFQSLLEGNDALKKESTPEYFKSLPTRKLEDYEKKWNSFLNKLLEYKTTLESGAEKLSESRAQIQAQQFVWDITYKNPKSEKAPKILLKRLTDLEKDVKSIDKILFKTLNSVLLLRDKITVEEISSKEILTNITSAITENKSLLFTFDSPPIWETLSDSTDSTTIGERWNSTSENISTSFKEFYDLYQDEFPFYILFFLIVLTIVLYLNRFAKQNIENFEANSDETHSLKVLNNPFAIST